MAAVVDEISYHPSEGIQRMSLLPDARFVPCHTNLGKSCYLLGVHLPSSGNAIY